MMSQPERKKSESSLLSAVHVCLASRGQRSSVSAIAARARACLVKSWQCVAILSLEGRDNAIDPQCPRGVACATPHTVTRHTPGSTKVDHTRDGDTHRRAPRARPRAGPHKSQPTTSAPRGVLGSAVFAQTSVNPIYHTTVFSYWKSLTPIKLGFLDDVFFLSRFGMAIPSRAGAS